MKYRSGHTENKVDGRARADRRSIRSVVLLVACFILVLSSAVNAGGLVWKAEKNSSVVYLGGTIHLLKASDYPLPGEYDRAYADAAKVVFETDLDIMKSPEVQTKIMGGAMLPEGQGLDKLLSEEAYAALEEYCASSGMPIATLNQFKPSMVMLTLVGLELQKLGIGEEGIDLFYHRKAIGDQKEILTLETIDQQIGFLLSMGEGYESDLVLHFVNDIHKTGEMMDELVSLWKAGKGDRLAELMLDDIREQFPDLYKSIFLDRNSAWIPVIEGYFDTPETELVLVGAGHLIGDDGVVSVLREKGYKVEQLK